MKDEWGNIICPHCKERKYKIVSVSCVENNPGILRFRAACPCKKKFNYERHVSEIGVYYKPDKPTEPIKPVVKPEVTKETKKSTTKKNRVKKAIPKKKGKKKKAK